MKTKIEWTDQTWNPVSGCTKVSQGCKHCYAERHAKRFWGARKFSDIRRHGERLDQPLRWRRPRRVFVNSMSDLFHPRVPFGFVDQVFAVMALASSHQFQILTKRPERMAEYMAIKTGQRLCDTTCARVGAAAGQIAADRGEDVNAPNWDLCWTWPLRNVWLGVSVEDQSTADERIPLLLRTPAALRFVSFEPLLGPVFMSWAWFARNMDETGIDWAICGGESGPSARPMHPDWARSIRDQCVAADVPFFFKQWGEWFPAGPRIFEAPMVLMGREAFYRLGKTRAGRDLDGRKWDEFPEVSAA